MVLDVNVMTNHFRKDQRHMHDHQGSQNRESLVFFGVLSVLLREASACRA
jgi:hypothetical protein